MVVYLLCMPKENEHYVLILGQYTRALCLNIRQAGFLYARFSRYRKIERLL